MKKRAQKIEFSRWECEELMVLFNNISTLKEAKEELERAKAERAAEREFIIQLLAGTLYFNLSSLKN